MKRKTLAVLTMAFALSTGVTAFAGGAWQQSADGRWWFSKDCGGVTAQTETWRRDDAGNWYSGASRDNLDNSYVSNGWWWIYDAAAGNMKCYYFDGSGYMLANTTTPDGYQVNEKGEWVKDGAVVAINPPAPYAVMKANFDHNQYLPGNYEANAEARKQQEGWQKDATGWWYRMTDGQFCANGWWWIFDSSIQGLKCYYFDANGYMLANGTAPDGSQLNLYGEWVKDGAVQVTAAPQAKMALPYSEASVAPSAGTTSTSGGVIYSENATSISTGGGYSSGTSSSGSHSSGTSGSSSSSKDENDKVDDAKAAAVETLKKQLESAFTGTGFSGHEITSSGENITMNVWSEPGLEDEVAVNKSWGSGKLSFQNAVQKIYQLYHDGYGLNGTITIRQVSARDHSVALLSAENGQIVYDILEDDPGKLDSIAGGGDETQSSGDNEKQQALERFKERIESSVEGRYNRYEIETSGTENVNLKLWADPSVDDALTISRDWGTTKESFIYLAQVMYTSYQNEYGLEGTFTVSVISSKDQSVTLLKAKNGQCVYDILIDDPEKVGRPVDSFANALEEVLADAEYGEFEVTVSGDEDIVLTERYDPEFDKDLAENGWENTKASFLEATQSLYSNYHDSYGLNGTFTHNMLSGTDPSVILLSAENGQIVYDILEDDPGKLEELTGIGDEEDVKNEMAEFFAETLTAGGTPFEGTEVTVSGEDVTFIAWQEPLFEEILASHKSWGDDETEFFEDTAKMMYKAYQDFGLNGTFTMSWASAKDHSVLLLSAENGEIVYDILEDDPELLEELANG